MSTRIDMFIKPSTPWPQMLLKHAILFIIPNNTFDILGKGVQVHLHEKSGQLAEEHQTLCLTLNQEPDEEEQIRRK